MIPASIAPLRNVGVLMALVEQVQNRTFGLPGMATYYGPSGWGKTTGVTFVANEFNAYVIQVKDCWTPTYLAEAIMREMGLPAVRGVARMVDTIGAQLARTDRPLIIDDAQYLLRKRMIELTRDLYESCQAPVILVGEEKLPQDLTRWENIHNRMLAWEPALPCNQADAEQLALIYASGLDVDTDLLRAIVDASGGSIRRVAVNLGRVRELARTRGAKRADLSMWGDRAFHTGQPPAVRQVEDFRSSRGSAAVTRKKGAA
ncbi:AAA family ATPase [Citreimonas salinaria]|uniref:AAA domain-containing protein n=1 Tax=Citreimonas salinaria TaxID=321339 RepID=A0A1H3KT65_9RHOB|nr:ATP-binding protein [Citreimonas salinaria]SDY54864.1 AAA domain-containing protein [Citreimonas salinaria]